MKNQEAIKWLKNLKNDIGNTCIESLQHYIRALDEIIDMLEKERTIFNKERLNKISSEVEETISQMEADDQISFDSWVSCPCSNYKNEEEARDDFISNISVQILEFEEKMKEQTIEKISHNANLTGTIVDTAVKYGYWSMLRNDLTQ